MSWAFLFLGSSKTVADPFSPLAKICEDELTDPFCQNNRERSRNYH